MSGVRTRAGQPTTMSLPSRLLTATHAAISKIHTRYLMERTDRSRGHSRISWLCLCTWRCLYPSAWGISIRHWSSFFFLSFSSGSGRGYESFDSQRRDFGCVSTMESSKRSKSCWVRRSHYATDDGLLPHRWATPGVKQTYVDFSQQQLQARDSRQHIHAVIERTMNDCMSLPLVLLSLWFFSFSFMWFLLLYSHVTASTDTLSQTYNSRVAWSPAVILRRSRVMSIPIRPTNALIPLSFTRNTTNFA